MTQEINEVIISKQEYAIELAKKVILSVHDLLEGGDLELNISRLKHSVKKLQTELAEINGIKLNKERELWMNNLRQEQEKSQQEN